MKKITLITIFIFLFGCDQAKDNSSTAKNQKIQKKHQHFLSQLEFTGIDFVHDNSMQGNYWPHEIMGGGAAVIDVDADGDLDLYFRQGSSDIDENKKDQLFINMWNETGSLQFKNGSNQYGLENYGYGMGITLGDIDQDGDEDLFLTNFGKDVMLENDAGQFNIIPGPWETQQWSTSAVFFDFNRDGWLDLYVGKYNQYQLGQDIKCFGANSQIDYCSPKSYPKEYDSLYINKNGVFVDISEELGVKTKTGYSLGVIAEDFNVDGWTDILVANDATKNLLWINQKGTGFVDEGLKRGIAVNGKGEMEASMGIGITDFDNDLDWDIIMTHLATESNTLYVNNGYGYFMDQSNKFNMVSLSKPYTSFGVGWLDVNDDLLEDLIIINGAVNSIPEQRQNNDPFPLRQRQQILMNQPGNRFAELVDESLPFINEPEVGRAAVFADFDNDGDKDFIVTVINGSPVFIENKSPETNWVGFELLNEIGAQALGSSMVVTFTDGSKEIKRFHNDGSYLAANDPRILIKWKGEKQIKEIVITWPQGQKQILNGVLKNQYQKVTIDVS